LAVAGPGRGWWRKAGGVGALLAHLPALALAAPTGPVAGNAEAVVVTAPALRVETLIDRRIYTVDADLQSLTGTVADVLGAVPSVEVDADGNVSLRGDASVTILVDGRPVAQLAGQTAGDALQQIPAQDIERIEVLTNPPAQYKAEGSAGVINIVTRRVRRSGLSGGAQASAGDHHRSLLSGSANLGAGPWNVSATASVRHDERERQVASVRTITDPATAVQTLGGHSQDETVVRTLPRLKLGVDFAPDEHRKVGAAFSRGERRGRRDFDQRDQSGPDAVPPTEITDRQSVGREWSFDTDQRLTFEQTTARAGESLNLALTRSVFREREHYDYVNLALLPAGPPTYDDLALGEDLVSMGFNADYAGPAVAGRILRFGVGLRRDDDGYDSAGDTLDPLSRQPTVDPTLTNQFRYGRREQAAYASYQAASGHWSLLGGLRLERTLIDTLQVGSNIAGRARYLRVYPSLHLERSVSDATTLSLGLTRRVAWPDASALNPFIDHQDTANLRAGNPSLPPQDTRAFELGVSVDTGRRTYGATGYLRLLRDAVTDVTVPVASDVVLTTKTTLPQSRAGGLEFTANGHLTAAFGYALSGNLYYSQIDGTPLGIPGLRSTAGLNAKFSLDYRKGRDAAQLSLSRSDRRLTPQGEIGALNQVNVGWRHPLGGTLVAVATVADLFNGQRYTRTVRSPLLDEAYRRLTVGRVGYVGLAYGFGREPRKAKPPGFDYDS